MIRPRSGQLLLSALLAIMSGFAGHALAEMEFEHVVPTRDQVLPLSETDRLFLDGQYQAAYDQLLDYVSSSETVAVPQLHNLGLLEQLLGISNGLTWLRLAWQHEPEAEYTAWSLGSALLNADSLDAAEPILREAVDLDSRFNEASIDLARCLRLRGKLDDAEHLLEGMVRRNRSDGEAFAELARVYLDRGGYENIERAASILEEGNAEFHFEPVLREWFNLLIARGKSEQAILAGSQYLESYPRTEYANEIAAALREIDPGSRHSAGGSYRQNVYRTGYPHVEPADLLPLDHKLTWHAKYGLIGVGEMTAEIAEGSYRNEPCWIARYTAHSTVPFVSIADTFYAWIDRDLRFTLRLDMIYHESGMKSRKTLETDYDAGICELRIRELSGYWWYDRLPIPPNLFDATSQLWFTQQLVMDGESGDCNVSIDHTFEHTSIEYEGLDGKMKLLDEVVPVKRLSGMMPYSGLAGLTGEYEGWFSDDERFLPAKAKFKIFLGSISILLSDYESTDLDMRVMESPATNRPQKTKPRKPSEMTEIRDVLERSIE